MKIMRAVVAVLGAAAALAVVPSAAWAAAPPTPLNPHLSKGTYWEANPPCYGQTPPSINATNSPEFRATPGTSAPQPGLKATLEIGRPGEGPFLRRTEETWPSGRLWLFAVTPQHFDQGSYQFRIRAENADGASAWTPWCTFTFEGSGGPSFAYSPDGGDHCLDVAAAGTEDGTKVQLWECNGTPAQAWRFQEYFGTLINTNSGKCLDVTAAGIDNGTKVQLYHCNRTGAQNWQRGQTHPNALSNLHSGKCLDVPAADFTNGNHLQIHTCHGGSAQVWEPIPLP